MMERSLFSLDEYIRNETENANRLNNEIDWNQIPLLNYVPLHAVADNSLVRFRGMIQDMLDPEIYLEKYALNRDDNNGTHSSRIYNGKYRDTLVCKGNEKVNYESSDNIQAERRTLFLVTIPGYNKWAENIEHKLIGFSEKTDLDAYSSSMELSSTNGETTLKRTRSDDDAMDIQTSDDNTMPNKRSNVKLSSNDNTPNGVIPSTVLSREFLLNSPIPERPSRACLVKVRSIIALIFSNKLHALSVSKHNRSMKISIASP